MQKIWIILDCFWIIWGESKMIVSLFTMRIVNLLTILCHCEGFARSNARIKAESLCRHCEGFVKPEAIQKSNANRHYAVIASPCDSKAKQSKTRKSIKNCELMTQKRIDKLNLDSPKNKRFAQVSEVPLVDCFGESTIRLAMTKNECESIKIHAPCNDDLALPNLAMTDIFAFDSRLFYAYLTHYR